MAFATLADNSTDLAAANFSDATGFADSATLGIVRNGSLIDTNLDAGAALSTGINYLHLYPGFTGSLGSADGSLETKFNSGYTTLPNFQMQNGAAWVTCTNACPVLRIYGGELHLTGGTVTELELLGGRVILSAGVTVTTLNQYGGRIEDVATSANAITTANIRGGQASLLRTVTTLNMEGQRNPIVSLEHATGPTTVTQRAGRLTMFKGSIATYNGIDGRLDGRYAKVALTIGSSATNLYPFGQVLSVSEGGLVTVSNLTNVDGGPVYAQGETAN